MTSIDMTIQVSFRWPSAIAVIAGEGLNMLSVMVATWT